MQETADIGEVNWQTALSYCEGLELSGYSDWRMPNIRELKSLVNHKASLNAVLDSVFQYETAYAACYYWSSTTNTTGNTADARVVCFGNGVPDLRDKANEPAYVRCVRGGVDGPKIQIDITSDKEIVYSGTENFDFKVRIDNIGEVDLSAIPISVEHATVFAAPGWTCSDEEKEKSENAVCTRIIPSDTGTTFSADIPAGGFITIKGAGDVVAIPVAVTVTASGAVKTVIRGSEPPADLPGTQTVKLCSQNGCTPDDDLGIDLSKDTIVLTHGLQPAGCTPEELWTAFEVSSDNPAPAGKLLVDKYGDDVNVLQFFWKGACHEHGWFFGSNKVPTRSAYEKGRKNVYYAGEQLAYLLLQNLTVMYSRKIHFIGHSLGTGVTAYTANLFLRQASYITDAQVTILDYPSTERVYKILGMDKKDGKDIGFDKNFFASTLPFDIERQGFTLMVDNYFSAKKGIFDTKAASFGVGTAINGKSFYNHPEQEDPGLIGALFLPEEGTANDHSGVHQWYRWTIKPKKEENFNGDSVCNSDQWNGLPYSGIVKLGTVRASLNPCNAGWHHSIIGGTTCPIPNGDEADKTSSFGIEPSNVTNYGCLAGGMEGSYICKEDNQALAPQAAAAEFAEMDSTESEDAPDRFYIELDVNVPEFVRYLSFDYTFTNVGDGDYVYLFAEGESIWLMSGNDTQQGAAQSSGQIPLRMTAGANKLVVALYGVGEKNAEFEIKNLRFTTVFDTDGDGCADDEDDFPEDPSKCTEEEKSPWLLFLPAIIGGSGTSVPETFSVTATAGSNGSLSSGTPSPQLIQKNNTATFTFNADSDYYVSSISGCGISYTNSDQTITNKNATILSVTNNCEVIASFALIPVSSAPCADRGLAGPEVVNWQGRDWQRCDDGIYHTREDAETYCQNLELGGYSDWHLPSKSELKTLVVCSNGKSTPLQDWDSTKTTEQNYIDATCCVSSTECDNYTKPTINSSFSSSTSWYWTTDPYLDGRYWIVGFNWGDAYWSYSANSVNKVRCVR